MCLITNFGIKLGVRLKKKNYNNTKRKRSTFLLIKFENFSFCLIFSCLNCYLYIAVCA